MKPPPPSIADCPRPEGISMNKTGRLLEPMGNSVPPERTDAETASAPVTNDGPAHTQMQGKSVAELQARSLHLQSPLRSPPDGFHLIRSELQDAFLAASLSPCRVLHATQRTLQHLSTPVFMMACCLHIYLVTQVFNFTLCVCTSVHHVHAMSMEARRKHGILWDWGHRQL